MADPELQIRGGGGGHPDPEIRRSPVSKHFFFRLFGARFWLKIRGGGVGSRVPRAPQLDPPLQRARAFPAIRGISRQEKTRRKKKDLCRPPTRSFI